MENKITKRIQKLEKEVKILKVKIEKRDELLITISRELAKLKLENNKKNK